MPVPDDLTLLRQYAQGDESVFAVLFERYVHLVYSTALRQVRNPAHAEEITQAVFIILAQKAKSIGPKTVLSGWLYQTARLTTANFIKREVRRQRREQEMYMQSTLTEPEASPWEQISPLLDGAMGRLGEKDRNAIVLRFFENKTPQEVAAALHLNEVTARKRVSRALEKLRKFFAQHGVSSTTAMIAGAISANSVQAAPTGLAQTISAVAMAKGAAASTSTLTLVKGALKMMAWTKTQTAVVAVVAGALLATTATTLVIKEVDNYRGYYKGKTLKQWLVNLDDQHPGPANDEAIAAVHHFGENGLPTIISMLKMRDPKHHNAVLACQVLGPKAKPAMPYLVNLLKSGYSYGYVGEALDRIGPDAVPVLLMLATNQTDETSTKQIPIGLGVTESAGSINVGVREEAIRSLGYINVYSRHPLDNYDVCPALISCLKDQYLRGLAANALGYLGTDERIVVPALVQTLTDPDPQNRWITCLALGKFGTQARIAVPALQNALHDEKPGVQATAAIALVQIEPDNAAQFGSLMPILINNINDKRMENFCTTTADVLAGLGDRAKPAVPALMGAIERSSGYERRDLIADLKKIDPASAANIRSAHLDAAPILNTAPITDVESVPPPTRKP